MKSLPAHPRWALFFASAWLLTSCAPLIARYNERTYADATDLKAESEALFEAATEPFAQHTHEVRELELRIGKATEYAKNIPKNEIAGRMWEVLIDPSGDLLGGFLLMWEERGSLSEAFVEEKKRQILQAFDQIIQLEAAKIKT
jgi:hypothetical protein